MKIYTLRPDIFTLNFNFTLSGPGDVVGCGVDMAAMAVWQSSAGKMLNGQFHGMNAGAKESSDGGNDRGESGGSMDDSMGGFNGGEGVDVEDGGGRDDGCEC